ncbi:MAG: DUF177 domain-containing protein [Chloroflexota bacterium]
MENISNPDLIFNVAQLLKEHVGATRRLTIESPSLTLYYEDTDEGDGGEVEARDLTGSAKATRVGEGLLVQGDVEANVQLQCSRCLEDISVPVEASLEEQFEPTVDVETGRSVKKDDDIEDDTVFTIDPNHMMDLTEPVRQALLVAIPMRPLCKVDCKGLCVVCGADLNDTDCGHTQEAPDARWEGLKALNIADFPVEKNAN